MSTKKDVRISTSLNEAEIDGLSEIINVMLRGGDARTIAKSPTMKRLLCKVHALKKTIEERKAST